MSAGPACPLCGGAAPKTLARKWRDYTLWDCPDCGLGFCEPFKNPGAAYYEGYGDMYGAVLQETTDPMSFEYDEVLALLSREAPRGARVLDVGCGAGGFLHRLKAAGFAPSGLDFNAARAKALRGRGSEVFEGGLPDFARTSPALFDAVTMFQVLEHVDDLAGWLSAARAVLKPGGLFLVATPNRERTFDPFQGPGLEEIDNPPHHLTRWSAGALSRALTDAGFQVRGCRALGYPLPLIQLLVRNRLRLGLATRALNVDQTRHAPAAEAAPASRGVVTGLVAAKEKALNALAWLFYPALAKLGRQGPVLLATARRP